MLNQIIASIISNISYYSTLLNDTNDITNITFGVNVATVTLSDTVDTSLIIGRKFNITGALFKNEIVSLTPVLGGYIVETIVNHDLTYLYDCPTTAQLTGFGGAWDDTFTVSSVDSPTTFTITTNLSAPTGTGYFLEDRYGTVRGEQTIIGVTSNTITFSTTTPFQLYDLTNAKINFNYRITTAFDEESALRHYNERVSSKKPWAFLIYGNALPSKDNTIDSDSIASYAKIDAISQMVDINFSILVILDSSDHNTSQVIQNQLIDFRFPLLKGVLGLRIDFEDYLNNQKYLVAFAGDAPAIYTGAYYGHSYNFQTQLIVSTAETIDNRDTAALRTMDIDLYLEGDNYEKIKKEIHIEFPT